MIETRRISEVSGPVSCEIYDGELIFRAEAADLDAMKGVLRRLFSSPMPSRAIVAVAGRDADGVAICCTHWAASFNGLGQELFEGNPMESRFIGVRDSEDAVREMQGVIDRQRDATGVAAVQFGAFNYLAFNDGAKETLIEGDPALGCPTPTNGRAMMVSEQSENKVSYQSAEMRYFSGDARLICDVCVIANGEKNIRECSNDQLSDVLIEPNGASSAQEQFEENALLLFGKNWRDHITYNKSGAMVAESGDMRVIMRPASDMNNGMDMVFCYKRDETQPAALQWKENNPARGHAAVIGFNKDGVKLREHFFEDGLLEDPAFGVAASTVRDESGRPKSVGHYSANQLQDPLPAVAAKTRFNDGEPAKVEFYASGVRQAPPVSVQQAEIAWSIKGNVTRFVRTIDAFADKMEHGVAVASRAVGKSLVDASSRMMCAVRNARMAVDAESVNFTRSSPAVQNENTLGPWQTFSTNAFDVITEAIKEGRGPAAVGNFRQSFMDMGDLANKAQKARLDKSSEIVPNARESTTIITTTTTTTSGGTKI